MTFFTFLLIVIVTVYGSSLIFAIIDKVEKKNTLLSLYESGAMASDVPVGVQISDMLEEVELEELNEYESVLEWDMVKNGERQSTEGFVLEISNLPLAE